MLRGKVWHSGIKEKGRTRRFKDCGQDRSMVSCCRAIPGNQEGGGDGSGGGDGCWLLQLKWSRALRLWFVVMWKLPEEEGGICGGKEEVTKP